MHEDLVVGGTPTLRSLPLGGNGCEAQGMKEQTQVNRPFLFLATAAVVLGTLAIHADARTVAINELGARLDRTADRFSDGALAVFTNRAAPATFGRPADEPLLLICESDGVVADGCVMSDDGLDCATAADYAPGGRYSLNDPSKRIPPPSGPNGRSASPASSPPPPAPASSPPGPDATGTAAEASPAPQTHANDEDPTDESEAFSDEDE